MRTEYRGQILVRATLCALAAVGAETWAIDGTNLPANSIGEARSNLVDIDEPTAVGGQSVPLQCKDEYKKAQSVRFSVQHRADGNNQNDKQRNIDNAVTTPRPLESMGQIDPRTELSKSIGLLTVVAYYPEKSSETGDPLPPVCAVRKCTASLIEGNRLLTAYHCARPASWDREFIPVAAFVRIGFLGPSAEYLKGVVWPVDPNPIDDISKPQYDVAIHPIVAESDAPENGGMIPLRLKAQKVVHETDYTIVGHPGGARLSQVSPCRIADREDGLDLRIYHSCEGNDGLSGSPIFSSTGDFIGIHLSNAPTNLAQDRRTVSGAVSFDTILRGEPEWGAGFLDRAIKEPRVPPRRVKNRKFTLPSNSLAAVLTHFKRDQELTEAKKVYGHAVTHERYVGLDEFIELETTLREHQFRISQRYRAGALNGVEIRHDWSELVGDAARAQSHCERLFHGLARDIANSTTEEYQELALSMQEEVDAIEPGSDESVEEQLTRIKERTNRGLAELCPTIRRIRLFDFFLSKVPKHPESSIAFATIFPVDRPDVKDDFDLWGRPDEPITKASYQACTEDGLRFYLSIDSEASQSGLPSCSVIISDYKPYITEDCVRDRLCKEGGV